MQGLFAAPTWPIRPPGGHHGHVAVGCGPKSGGASDPSDKVGEEPGASGSSDKAEKGKPAPEIEAEAVTGDGPKSIAEAKGTVTIVDFWATFCDPCRKSFPKYQELVDKHAGKLAVIAVSVDDPEGFLALLDTEVAWLGP